MDLDPDRGFCNLSIGGISRFLFGSDADEKGFEENNTEPFIDYGLMKYCPPLVNPSVSIIYKRSDIKSSRLVKINLFSIR